MRLIKYFDEETGGYIWFWVDEKEYMASPIFYSEEEALEYGDLK